MTDDFARHLDICLGLRAYSHPATIRNPPSNFQPSVVGQNGADICVLHTPLQFPASLIKYCGLESSKMLFVWNSLDVSKMFGSLFPSCFAMNIWSFGCLQVSQVILDKFRQIPSYSGMSCVDGMGKPLDRTKAGGFFVRLTDQLDLRISLNQPEKKASCHPKWRKHVQVPCFTFRELWW